MMRRLGIVVDLLLCLVVVSACAATSSVRAAGPDYVHDPTANVQAQLTGSRLVTEIEHDPTYAGIEITEEGLAVHAVGGGSTALKEAVKHFTEVPARVLSARNSLQSMQVLTERLNDDQPMLRRQGIRMSMWGPDIRHNKVVITLEKYHAAQAQLLLNRYGRQLLAVSTTEATVTAN